MSDPFNIEAKRTVCAFNLSCSKQKLSFILGSMRKQVGLVFNFTRTKQYEMEFLPCQLRKKRPGCSKISEEWSEAKGLSPTFSKSKVERIGVFQKFAKTKQNEVKFLKILQDQSETNFFISDCEEEEKLKKSKLRFFGTKRRKTKIIVPKLSKICHC